jgi:hypothetical protein
VAKITKKNPKGAGRKRIKFNDDELKEVARMAGLGISESRIAESFGVSLSTIARRKRDSAKFDTALKRGKTRAIDEVSSALFDSATGRAGKDPNTTAQIFFLKNRSSDEWKDRIETTHDHSINLNAVLQNAQKRIIDLDSDSTETAQITRNTNKHNDSQFLNKKLTDDNDDSS